MNLANWPAPQPLSPLPLPLLLLVLLFVIRRDLLLSLLLLFVFASSLSPVFPCQAPPTETNTQLRPQTKQKQILSLRK
jgi:hypothetical protein